MPWTQRAITKRFSIPPRKTGPAPLIFAHEFAADAWRSVLGELYQFNFKEIRTDILGDIFQRLIAPEERHKFGQHYTNEDLVDVVNAFCIRKADDVVFDPGVRLRQLFGSRLSSQGWMAEDKRLAHPSVSHQDRLAEIYGSDISLFAAHLATLNLASRDINEEENYPRIARRNFFEIRDGQTVLATATGLRGEKTWNRFFCRN